MFHLRLNNIKMNSFRSFRADNGDEEEFSTIRCVNNHKESVNNHKEKGNMSSLPFWPFHGLYRHSEFGPAQIIPGWQLYAFTKIKILYLVPFFKTYCKFFVRSNLLNFFYICYHCWYVGTVHNKKKFFLISV